MSRPWTYWYSPRLGHQEQLWCAAQADDVDQVRRCLALGASASLPGPHGTAIDLAISSQSHRVMAAMGWTPHPDDDAPLTLEQLDQAVARIEDARAGLGVGGGDEFLDILPYLGNACLVPPNALQWKGPNGITHEEERALFRMAHQHEAVLCMVALNEPPVLLLSESGAKRWAPRLLEDMSSPEPLSGTSLH